MSTEDHTTQRAQEIADTGVPWEIACQRAERERNALVATKRQFQSADMKRARLGFSHGYDSPEYARAAAESDALLSRVRSLMGQA